MREYLRGLRPRTGEVLEKIEKLFCGETGGLDDVVKEAAFEDFGVKGDTTRPGRSGCL